MNNTILANVAAAVSSLSAGMSIVATRFIINETDPISLAFFRYLIAAFCLFPIFILIIPTYTQSACETVKEGYEIYFQRDITPAYLEEANINALKALKNNCPDLNID